MKADSLNILLYAKSIKLLIYHIFLFLTEINNFNKYVFILIINNLFLYMHNEDPRQTYLGSE